MLGRMNAEVRFSNIVMAFPRLSGVFGGFRGASHDTYMGLKVRGARCEPRPASVSREA
jgi:hypothetical protein